MLAADHLIPSLNHPRLFRPARVIQLVEERRAYRSISVTKAAPDTPFLASELDELGAVVELLGFFGFGA